MDVMLLVTMGEGFGIPLVEAQACGCPVITGDWTANAELVFSGWKVPKVKATPFWTPLASWQYIPHVGAIAERLEAAYRMKDNQEYRDAARKGALKYDADKVLERYWKPAMEQMQAEIDAWKPQPEAVTA
jgi:glycosyltransferase involved in cell wall biosynthesis